MAQEELLRSIDMKLSSVLALLALSLPVADREGAIVALRSGGVSTAEIASFMGKSRRWVQATLKEKGFKE